HRFKSHFSGIFSGSNSKFLEVPFPVSSFMYKIRIPCSKGFPFHAIRIDIYTIHSMGTKRIFEYRHMFHCDQVVPLISLTTEKSSTTYDGQNQPKNHTPTILPFSFLYRSDHSHRTCNQDKTHHCNENKR